MVVFIAIYFLWLQSPMYKEEKARAREVVNIATRNYWFIPPDVLEDYLKEVGLSDNDVNPISIIRRFQESR